MASLNTSILFHPQGPTKPSSLIAVSTILPGLCMAAIILRFNLRRRLQKVPLLLDDWITLPTLIFVFGMNICALLGVSKHIWSYNFSDDKAVYEAKILALSGIKLSAITFYYRIFANKSHVVAFDIIQKVTFAVVLLWTLAMTLMNTFQCGTHVSALWGDFSTFCQRVPAYTESSVISNTVLDLWIIVLPLPRIWTLHTSTRRKVAISGVFLLALIGLAASVARMAIFIQLAPKMFSYDINIDYFLLDTLTVFWSNLESGISLLAVNLPSLWDYRKYLPAGKFTTGLSNLTLLRSFRSNDDSHLSKSNSRLDTHGMEVLSERTSSMDLIFSRSTKVQISQNTDVEMGVV